MPIQPQTSRIEKVRTTLPMGIRRNTCGNVIPKETNTIAANQTSSVLGEVQYFLYQNYLGIRIFRSYFKRKCSAQIGLSSESSDPKNLDYDVEAGARHDVDYEYLKFLIGFRQVRKASLLLWMSSRSIHEAEEEENMQYKDSVRAKEILAALDELKSMKKADKEV